jgi:hypothetical protein
MLVYRYTDMRAAFAAAPTIAADGYELWPSANLQTATFTGIDTPITEFPITISVDSGANGSEVYHAYLSQRTDDAASQYLSIAVTSGKSGSWDISLTSLAVDALGLDDPTDSLNLSQLTQALKYVTLYTSKISDQTIRYVELLPTTLVSGDA